jgi:hypothetical protein
MAGVGPVPEGQVTQVRSGRESRDPVHDSEG